MPEKTKRKFARRRFDALVRYSMPSSGDYGIARASDRSRGGMRFRTFHPLAAGDDIEIVLPQVPRKKTPCKTYVGYLAQIRWCRELAQVQHENFDVGANFLEEKERFDPYPFPDQSHACDLCGKNVARECVCYFEGAVCLCQSCHNYLARISDGPVKAGIRKYLFGNVI